MPAFTTVTHRAVRGCKAKAILTIKSNRTVRGFFSREEQCEFARQGEGEPRKSGCILKVQNTIKVIDSYSVEYRCDIYGDPINMRYHYHMESQTRDWHIGGADMEESQKSNTGKNSSLVWGVLLIVFGILSLISNTIELDENTWVVILAVGGVLALGLYLVDRSRLVNLLPSYILFGVSGLIYMVTNNILQDGVIAVYILSVVAVPFVVGYLADQAKNWGLLVPAYVLLAVSGIILIAEGSIISEDFIPTYVLSAIALPFLIGYLRDPAKNTGLLLPAYILMAVGIMVLLIIREVLEDLLIPSYVMFAVALPFFWAYYQNREKAGFLVPAGILSLVGLSFLLFNESLIQYVIPGILIVTGVALIMRQSQSKGGESPT